MRRLGLFVFGLLLLANGAYAQDTTHGEISGGWRYYHATLNALAPTLQVQKPTDFPKGWYGDVGYNLSPKFALVGEASGVSFREHFSSTSTSLTTEENARVSMYVFMGGVRIRAPQNARLVPFGQVLFGGQHNSSASDRTLTFRQGAPSYSRVEYSGNGSALALDSGVTIAAGWIGIRASAGYVRFFGKTDSDAFRLTLGAAYRF